MSTHQTPSNTVVRFKEYYEQFSQRSMTELADLYASDAHFIDAIHDIDGFDGLKRHFESMCAGLIECRFEFMAETVTPSDVWFQWRMHYRHPRLKKGAPLSIVGASHIVWHDEAGSEPGKVKYHEDFYDMGAMLYEHIPLLGRLILMLKNRL